MKRLTTSLALIAIFAGLLGSTASARLYCPVRSSIFGTVVEVQPNMLTLRTIRNGMGYIHVTTRGARLNSNGLALRPGVFAGVFGCLDAGSRAFTGEEITLATDANAYNGYPRRTQVVEGRIDAVRGGRVLIDSGGGHGDLWVYTNQAGLKVGQRIRATGTFDPMNADFVASSIAITAQ